MNIEWKPFWYELDQSIVVGDIDFFYLTKDKSHFANGPISEVDYEIKAEILDIKHKMLGNIKGIITIGLDYTVYLNNGEVVQVNAEESPGEISESNYVVDEWNFDVYIKIIEETGTSSKKRLSTLSKSDIKILVVKRIENYKRLLNLTTL